jgi:hypothetical protein
MRIIRNTQVIFVLRVELMFMQVGQVTWFYTINNYIYCGSLSNDWEPG